MLNLLFYPFVQNAILAGSFVAIISGILGYFLISRGLTFAGHALAEIGFAGAAGALLVGLDPIYGLLSSTVLAGIGIGIFGRKLRERDITIGIFMMFMLGLGSLFIALYNGYAERAYSILFGTILGISTIDVLITAIFSLFALIAILFLFRPLLFSSFDPELAESRGVPVGILSVLFLVLVGVTVSVAVQVVGVLLIFTLLVGPAATAVRITKSPINAIILAIVLGLIYTWVGVLMALSGNIPVSFYIASISFFVYLPVRIFTGGKS